MPRDEIDTLRAGYEAFSRGDWDAVLAQAHPDLELITADRVTNPGTYRGPDEIRQFFEDLFAPFDEVLTEPEEFHERGDQIVVFVRVRSRPRGSTAVVDNRIAHVWTVADGTMTRLQVFANRDEALVAAASES
jgi:uncharacterized protein